MLFCLKDFSIDIWNSKPRGNRAKTHVINISSYNENSSKCNFCETGHLLKQMSHYKSPLHGILFQSAFLLTMSIHDWWNGANGGLQFGSGHLIYLPLSVHSLVVEYWLFVGTHRQPTICVILLLCFSLWHHPAPPRAPYAHPEPLMPTPYIHWPDINEFHEKIIKTGKNQPTSNCQVSCRKANR